MSSSSRMVQRSIALLLLRTRISRVRRQQACQRRDMACGSGSIKWRRAELIYGESVAFCRQQEKATVLTSADGSLVQRRPPLRIGHIHRGVALQQHGAAVRMTLPTSQVQRRVL
jgi:hypothetical protein